MMIKSESGRDCQRSVRVDAAGECIVLHAVLCLVAIDGGDVVTEGFVVDVRRNEGKNEVSC